MSDDFEFEVIDASSVQHSQRTRKPKYKTKPWEYWDAKGEYEYYKIVQRNYRRRHNVSETPYDHMIDPVLAREEEYTKLFPVTLAEIRLMLEEEKDKKK